LDIDVANRAAQWTTRSVPVLTRHMASMTNGCEALAAADHSH
jgi:hypothetical protein